MYLISNIFNDPRICNHLFFQVVFLIILFLIFCDIPSPRPNLEVHKATRVEDSLVISPPNLSNNPHYIREKERGLLRTELQPLLEQER